MTNKPELQTEEEKKVIKERFDDLVNRCPEHCTEEEKAKIKKAFDFSNEAHMGVRRKSGEPYIFHPLAVARIVEDMGLGHKSISAALLHDVVEDTEYTVEDIRMAFGDKIAMLVDGLTKLEMAFDKGKSQQAENFKKILLTLTDDVRVIMIKLADRLHNMRTLDSMSPNKQLQIAGETRFLFAPLAHRLGFYSIKSELEDLSLKYYYPEAYEEIKNKIEQKKFESEDFVNRFEAPIIEKLDEAGIEYHISSRFKSIYSTWHKMEDKKVPFEEVYDLFAIRIVFKTAPGIPERTQCWSVYSLISEVYKTKMDRLRDWVGTPKANGYEAIHCTLLGPGGTWVEVQIRTERMEDIAERGIAAHWKYKASDIHESELDKWLRQVKENMEDPNVDALEFLENFRLSLLNLDIFVFTPKGRQITLPKGATILDFAYEIHSEVGYHATAAKINHKLVPINHVLRSGDQVEIITTDNQKPAIEWLNYAITPKARHLIKGAIKSEVKERAKEGRIIIEEKLAEVGIKPSARTYRKLLDAYKQSDKRELFANVGAGIIDLKDFNSVLRENTPQKLVEYWGMQLGIGRNGNVKDIRKQISDKAEKKVIDKKSTYLLKEDVNDKSLSYTISDCCKPIPGDEIIGFSDENNETVIVHKKMCPEATKMAAQRGDRIVKTQWTAHKIWSFLEIVEIRGLDRIGILKDISEVITEQLNVNIRKLNIDSHDGIFEGTIELYIHDASDLKTLMEKVGSIKGMHSVKRVEQISHQQQNL